MAAAYPPSAAVSMHAASKTARISYERNDSSFARPARTFLPKGKSLKNFSVDSGYCPQAINAPPSTIKIKDSQKETNPENTEMRMMSPRFVRALISMTDALRVEIGRENHTATNSAASLRDLRSGVLGIVTNSQRAVFGSSKKRTARLPAAPSQGESAQGGGRESKARPRCGRITAISFPVPPISLQP